jgi:hypothetical protein
MTVPNQPWERLYADIKIDVPGVTDAVLQQKLFQCAKDFIEQTNIWTEEVPITGMPNVTVYPFTLAGMGVPNRLMILYDPAISVPNNYRWVQSGVSMPIPGTIQVRYAPSTQVDWVAVIGKSITDPSDAEGYPELDADYGWIVDKYRMAFYYGTLARLEAQPAKPYSNPNLASAHNRLYITERSKARTDVLKQNTFGAQAWSYPQAFASITRKGWA